MAVDAPGLVVHLPFSHLLQTNFAMLRRLRRESDLRCALTALKLPDGGGVFMHSLDLARTEWER